MCMTCVQGQSAGPGLSLRLAFGVEPHRLVGWRLHHAAARAAQLGGGELKGLAQEARGQEHQVLPRDDTGPGPGPRPTTVLGKDPKETNCVECAADEEDR